LDSFAAVTNCDIFWYDDDDHTFVRSVTGNMHEIKEVDEDEFYADHVV
jgi:hypothetical protein